LEDEKEEDDEDLEIVSVKYGTDRNSVEMLRNRNVNTASPATYTIMDDTDSDCALDSGEEDEFESETQESQNTSQKNEVDSGEEDEFEIETQESQNTSQKNEVDSGEEDEFEIETQESQNTSQKDEDVSMASSLKVKSYVLAFDPGLKNIGFVAYEVITQVVMAIGRFDVTPSMTKEDAKSTGFSVTSIAVAMQEELSNIKKEFSPVVHVLVEDQLSFCSERKFATAAVIRKNQIVQTCILQYFLSHGIKTESISSRLVPSFVSTILKETKPTKRNQKKGQTKRLVFKLMNECDNHFNKQACSNLLKLSKKDDACDALIILLVPLKPEWMNKSL
jgi:hypothetical protein